MLFIAFTLGFIGSLHCIGMCGPLALSTCNMCETKQQAWKNSVLYHVGRISTYVLLGFIFATVGSLLFIANIQKGIAIACGLILILTFLFKVNIDSSIQHSKLGKLFYKHVGKALTDYMSMTTKKSPIVIGLLNGLLPCGLVYLALAGALTTGSTIAGGLFMLCFGIGTVPALSGLVVGYSFMPFHWRKNINYILPLVSLSFGVFLIYRGIMVDMPMQLDFIEAMRNPVLCH